MSGEGEKAGYAGSAGAESTAANPEVVRPPAWLVTLLRVVSALGLGAGVLGLVGGLALVLTSLGATGLGRLVILAGVMAGIGGIGLLVLSAVIFQSTWSLGDQPRQPSRAERRASAIVSVLAGVLGAMAIVGLVILGPDAALAGVAAAAAVTFLMTGGAYIARFVPRDGLRTALLRLILVLLVPMALVDQAIASEALGRAGRALDEQALPDRMAAVERGPDAATLAGALDGIGPWRVVAAGTYPAQAAARWMIGPTALSDLAGREIGLAVLGQCWGTPHYQTLSGSVFLTQARDAAGEVLESHYFSLPNIRCSGAVSGIIALANGTGLLPAREVLSVFAASGWPLFEVYIPQYPDTAGPRAERWILLISDQPGSPLDTAVDAFEGAVR